MLIITLATMATIHYLSRNHLRHSSEGHFIISNKECSGGLSFTLKCTVSKKSVPEFNKEFGSCKILQELRMWKNLVKKN